MAAVIVSSHVRFEDEGPLSNACHLVVDVEVTSPMLTNFASTRLGFKTPRTSLSRSIEKKKCMKMCGYVPLVEKSVFGKLREDVYLIDLIKSFPWIVWLRKSEAIQTRASLSRFLYFIS